MARPMVWIFIFFAGGILSQRVFGLGWGLLGFGALAAILAVIYYFIYKRKIAWVLPIFALLGALLFANAIRPTDSALEEIASQEGFVRLEGIVHDIGLTRTGRQRVHVRTSEGLGIRAYLPEGIESVLGQRVSVAGYLIPLDTPRNPGGFNEFQFLRARGVEYRLFAETAALHEVNMTIPLHIRSFGLRLSAVFHDILPPDMAGIMSAMVVGDRGGLQQDTRQMYASVGMFHILVVSGLHVNIMALFLSKALQTMGINSAKKRGLITIGFLITFTILTGAGVATMRAAIMGISFVLVGMLGFENDAPTSLGLAAVSLLLFQPLFLFDLGFIYSFVMVLALLTLTQPLEKLINRAPFLPFKPYIAFNAAAALTYTLINSLFFYEFSPYALLANLLIMPTVAVVLVLGLLTSIVGLFSILAAQIVAFPIWALLSLYEFIMQTILLLPGAVILTGRPSIIVLAIITAAILLIAYTKHKRKTMAAAAFALLAYFAFGFFNQTITTTFLYVGQGESVVISRRGDGLIIDGGGTFGRGIGENVGSFTLIPYLNYRGINQASAIITHNHSDHAIGIIEAMQAGRVNHLILAYANSQPGNNMYDLALQTAYSQGIPITYVAAGDAMEFHNMRLYILHPYGARISQNYNNYSLVIRAVHGQHSILFTGDIEAHAETALANQSGELGSSILQIAHHGSRTSTTQAFLNAVNPQIAIISAGRNNMFNHPHPSVINRLYENNIPHFTTSQRGAIVISTTERNMTITTMLR